MCQVVVFSLVKVHSLFIKFYFNNIFFIIWLFVFHILRPWNVVCNLKFDSYGMSPFFPLSFSLLFFSYSPIPWRRWLFYKFKSIKCKSIWKFVSWGPFDNKRAFFKLFLKQYMSELWVIFFDSNIMHNDIIISIIQY